MAIRLEFNSTPPSLNRTGASGHWRQWKRHKDAWQQMIGLEMMSAVSPRRKLTTPVVVDALLSFPVRRKRDEGNYRSLLEKACGDALVDGGWIPDDEPQFFRFRTVMFDKRPRPETLLEITEGVEADEHVWTRDGGNRQARRPRDEH